MREEDCVALAERVGPGTDLTWVAADLTDEGETERAFAKCAETFGRLDALLACAGGSGRPFGDGPLHSTSLESWNTTVALNLNTAFLSSREAVKIMLDQPTGGSVVYISSVAATNPVAGRVQHARLLGGQGRDQLADASTERASTAPHGIRFNAILPALTLTPMSKRAASDPDTLDIVKARMPVSGGGPLSRRRSRPGRAVPLQRRVEAHHRPTDPVDGGWGVN